MEFELEYAESPVSVQDKPMFPTPGATKFLEERKKRQELEDAQLEEEERNE